MSLPSALLLPSAGRFPFTGHFRLLLGDAPTTLSVAGRVAGGTPPEQAWAAVLTIHDALSDVEGSDCQSLLNAAWTTLSQLAPEMLGAPRGDDLSVLMVARDAQGHAVAGLGLDGIWGRIDGELRQLGDPDGALTRPTGLPTGVQPVHPGSPRAHGYVGVCKGDPAKLPSDLALACGVRR